MNLPAWQPLLEDEDAARAREIIRAVTDEVRSHLDVLCELPGDATLAGGTPGVALLCAYARRHDPNLATKESIERLLQHAIASEGRKSDSSLYFGAVGVGWTVHHLRQDVSSPLSAVCDELDEVIAASIARRSNWAYNHELFRGLSGVALYVLERQGCCPRDTLQNVVRALLSGAERPAPGLLSWLTNPVRISNPTSESREPYFNIGVPHGSLAPLYVLGHAAAVERRFQSHFDDSVRWHLGQRHSRTFPCFGTVAGGGGKTSWLPIAWCYGDLGIAAVLAAGSRPTMREDCLQMARELAEIITTQPVDSDSTSLCHGSAGNAHLLARLYQACGGEELRDSAVSWYRLLIQQWKPGAGFGGFSASNVRTLNASGFLRGASGAALALLGGISTVEPEWDRLLLASSVPIKH